MGIQRPLSMDIRAFLDRFGKHRARGPVWSMLSAPQIMDRVIQFSGRPGYPTHQELLDLTTKVRDAAGDELDEFDENPQIIVNRCNEFLKKLEEAINHD